MELEKNSEMKKTVDRRRQFFSVDKDVSVWSLFDLDFDLQRRERPRIHIQRPVPCCSLWYGVLTM